MKKLNTLLLIIALVALFSCGSTKNAVNQSSSNVETNKIELPPNVNSNKYSKKRQKY
jgi:hypothetical protein